MGEIVFAAATSHAPHITGVPELAAPDKKRRFYDAMHDVGRRLAAARPDLIVVASADHFHNLFTDRMPAFCVGIADRHRGPAETWIRIDPFEVRGGRGFAQLLMGQAFESGFDPAFSERIVLEHGLAVPLSFLTPGFDVPVVPVLQNCLVPPLPSLRRCFDFGALVRSTAILSSLRVAVIGTGGLSHAPGAPEAGQIDSDFDRQFLATLSSERPMEVLSIPNERIDRAGFGTWEIRQWATALGASGGGRAEVLVYEPIEEWETGCAAAVFELA